jgi:hypothetical protein
LESFFSFPDDLRITCFWSRHHGTSQQATLLTSPLLDAFGVLTAIARLAQQLDVADVA